MAQFQESHETSISSISTLSPEAFVEDVIAESQAAYDRLHDPITARREAAVRNMRNIGLMDEAELASFGPELITLTGAEPRIARVMYAEVYQPYDNQTHEVEQLIVASYLPDKNGEVDVVINRFDRKDHTASRLSKTLQVRIGELCLEQEEKIFLMPGGQDRYSDDLYELAVADGRDRGMRVRDQHRPAGEPPVTGVREYPSANEQPNFGLAA